MREGVCFRKDAAVKRHKADGSRITKIATPFGYSSLDSSDSDSSSSGISIHSGRG
jgi:hypothetical protein